MSAELANSGCTPRAVIRRARYRLGGWCLRPLMYEMRQAMDATPPVEVPSRPPVGAPHAFRERQAYARKITERNALNIMIRQSKAAIADLVGLARVWPHTKRDWREVVWEGFHEQVGHVHPFSSIYDVGHMERATERIAGLEDRNEGLTDLVRRLYRRFIDEMPADLAAEMETNLGMSKRSILTIADRPDESWKAADNGQAETPSETGASGSNKADS